VQAGREFIEKPHVKTLTDDDLRQQLHIEAFRDRRLLMTCFDEIKHPAPKDFFLAIDYDGMKSLLETFLLINALVLTFAFSSFFAVEHDKIVAADTRYLTMILRPSFKEHFSVAWTKMKEDGFQARNPIAIGWLGPNESSLLSFHYFNSIVSANFILFTTLLAGTLCYTSLMLSDAKKRRELMSLWRNVFILPVIGLYIAMGIGIHYLSSSFSCFCNMSFPIYNIRNLTTTSAIGDVSSVTMNLNGGYPYFALKMDLHLGYFNIACYVATGFVVVCHLLVHFAPWNNFSFCRKRLEVHDEGNADAGHAR
jgi:hypothetical protein